ncbi:MAG: hypothetical protein AB7W28_09600, partial [Armatimonadota bacterium]
SYEPPQDRQLSPRWQYGGIIASADPVAADLVGQQIIEAYRAKIGIQPATLQPQPTYLRNACLKTMLSRAIPGPIEVHVHGVQEDALIK